MRTLALLLTTPRFTGPGGQFLREYGDAGGRPEAIPEASRPIMRASISSTPWLHHPGRRRWHGHLCRMVCRLWQHDRRPACRWGGHTLRPHVVVRAECRLWGGGYGGPGHRPCGPHRPCDRQPCPLRGEAQRLLPSTRLRSSAWAAAWCSRRRCRWKKLTRRPTRRIAEPQPTVLPAAGTEGFPRFCSRGVMGA